jgi:hypothetical protein
MPVGGVNVAYVQAEEADEERVVEVGGHGRAGNRLRAGVRLAAHDIERLCRIDSAVGDDSGTRRGRARRDTLFGLGNPD